MRTAAGLAALLVTVVASAELPPDCRFGAGALPEETLPAGLPHGDQIPIDHILVHNPPFMKPPRMPDPKIYRANAQRCVQILGDEND
jgi:hypothetical protein